MQQTPAELLEEYLDQHNITPEEFAQISAMPLTEVKGIMEGELPVTILRANHLAAVFDTKPDMWLNISQKSTEKVPSRSNQPIFSKG